MRSTYFSFLYCITAQCINISTFSVLQKKINSIWPKIVLKKSTWSTQLPQRWRDDCNFHLRYYWCCFRCLFPSRKKPSTHYYSLLKRGCHGESYPTRFLFISHSQCKVTAVPAAGSPVIMLGCSSDRQTGWPWKAPVWRERRKGAELQHR